MTEDEYADDGRPLDEQGRPVGTPLAGPGEDGPEPPEALGPNDRGAIGTERVRAAEVPYDHTHALAGELRNVTIDPVPRSTASPPIELDPVYLAQEGSGEFPVGEGMAEAYARPALVPVDEADDRMAEAIYVACLVEPYGHTVPAWERLTDRTRDIYRRQARRVRELLGETTAASVEPQRVVVGFGSAAVATEVVDTLRRWKEKGFAFGEVEALLRRIEESGQ